LQEDTNEVLEWLGDGVLQSVVAIYLYKRLKVKYNFIKIDSVKINNNQIYKL
jgi:dsRNA-specific ribonuclease